MYKIVWEAMTASLSFWTVNPSILGQLASTSSGQYKTSLTENIDREKGINVEKFEVESLNSGFELLDANFNIEDYERIKVKTINNSEAIALVHGSIVYLRKDFEESGGEYLVKLFLKQDGNQWTVVKTDEYTLPEYKEWLKEGQK